MADKTNSTSARTPVTRERFGKAAIDEAMKTIFTEGDDEDDDAQQQDSEFEDCDLTYTIFGKHDYVDDGIPVLEAGKNHTDACARFLCEDGQETLSIRSGDQGSLYHNPIHGMNLGTVHNKQKHGNLNYKFLKVNRKTFNMYTQFLATKNIAWLNNAERESI